MCVPRFTCPNPGLGCPSIERLVSQHLRLFLPTVGMHSDLWKPKGGCSSPTTPGGLVPRVTQSKSTVWGGGGRGGINALCGKLWPKRDRSQHIKPSPYLSHLSFPRCGGFTKSVCKLSNVTANQVYLLYKAMTTTPHNPLPSDCSLPLKP